MNYLKRLSSICMAGILLLSFTACHATGSKNSGITISSSSGDQIVDLGPDLTGKDFSGYRVGVSLADCTSNTYCATYVQAMNESMAEYGVDATVYDAFGDPGQQAAQIKTLINMNVDLLILWPSNSNSAVNWVKDVSEAGIPVIMANTNIATEGETYVEGFVGPSGTDEAYQTACKMLIDLEGRGSIAVFNGPNNYAPVQERRKGLKDALAASKVTVLEEYYDSASRSVAKTVMEECLKKHSIGEIDAVFCYDDEAALGVFDAMSSMNRSGEMKVYIAASGNYDILSYIDNGMVSATAIQSPIVDAKTTVNYALSFLLGNPLPQFYNYISTPIATPDNVDSLELSVWGS